jgi:hypothetical protein
MSALEAMRTLDATPRMFNAGGDSPSAPDFSAELDKLYGAKFEKATLKTTDDLSMIEGEMAVEFAVDKMLIDIGDNNINSKEMEELTRDVIGSYGDTELGLMSLQIALSKRLQDAKSPWTVELSFDEPTDTVGMRWTHRDPGVVGVDLRFRAHEKGA